MSQSENEGYPLIQPRAGVFIYHRRTNLLVIFFLTMLQLSLCLLSIFYKDVDLEATTAHNLSFGLALHSAIFSGLTLIFSILLLCTCWSNKCSSAFDVMLSGLSVSYIASGSPGIVAFALFVYTFKTEIFGLGFWVHLTATLLSLAIHALKRKILSTNINH